MAAHSPSEGWIGASLLRKEDARHLLGHGMFIADVRMPGMQDIAFVRSQMAHARVRRVTKPPDARAHVFTLADSARSTSSKPGPKLAAHRHSPYPALADDRVRYVGQPIAACMRRRARRPRTSPTRSTSISRNCRRWSIASRRCAPAARGVRDLARQRLHHQHGDRRRSGLACVRADPAAPPVPHEPAGHRARSNAAACWPIGTIATTSWSCYLSTQGGHVMRIGLSQALGLPENKLRVIAPDVGGGFGGKNRLMPEDIAVAALAMKVGHPVRWIEDRREHLLAVGACPRSLLRSHHLGGPRRHAARHRRRGLYRRRRLFAVADRLVHGSEHGVAQSDRPLPHPPSQPEDLHGRHQQGADGPLSRRRAAGRLLRDRAAGRRGGARARPRAVRPAPAEHRHVGGAAVSRPRPACGSTPATISRRSTPRAT